MKLTHLMIIAAVMGTGYYLYRRFVISGPCTTSAGTPGVWYRPDIGSMPTCTVAVQ